MIVFQYPVNINLENERLEKNLHCFRILLPFTSHCVSFAGKNNMLAVYFIMLASAIGKLYCLLLSFLRYTRASYFTV